jgi:peroxiredoxin
MFGRKGGFAPLAVGDPAAKFGVAFPLLADTAREVSTAYRALRPGSRWPLRTVYLIGTDGRVRFSRRGAPDADEILELLG